MMYAPKRSFPHFAVGRSLVCRSLVSCLLVMVGSVAIATQPTAPLAPKPVKPEPVNFGPLNFDLPGSELDSVQLSANPDVELQVVCFLGTECPLARLYGPRLQQLANKYQPRVAFVGVDPNQQDSMEEIKRYRKQHKIQFPIGKDHDQRVTQQYGATRTPEVFVVDRAGVIRYQGRIDDQYQPGVSRASPTTHDLDKALEDLLEGNPLDVPVTEAVGCRIAPHRVPDPDSKITFADQVSRVLIRNCVECHREGEIGPFALTDYDEVVGWADMILEVIDNGRMPPWHATGVHRSFKNARQMSDEDRQMLHAWVDAGTPFGEASELPSLPEKVAGWRLPNPPDQVFAMSEQPFPVPAEGTVEYQYFVVDPGFETDRWLSAAEVIPGNRSVVHHCIVFIRPPDGTDMREIGFLSAYVPGQEATVLPKGYARRVRAGSHFVVQMHYTPTGTAQQDLTTFGVNFVPESEVTHEVFVTGGIEQDFEIPPRADDFGIEGQVSWWPEDGELLAIAPHMHVRGKSFQMFAQSDDGDEPLLDVPNYDFNWQHNYELSTPLPLHDIERLHFRCTYDNSAANPNNPDPDEYVTWGDQTWEEMSVVFLQVARPRQASRPRPNQPSQSTVVAKREAAAKEFVKNFLGRFDHDHNGVVARSEVPTSFRMYQFRSTDSNGDDLLDTEELEQAALNHSR